MSERGRIQFAGDVIQPVTSHGTGAAGGVFAVRQRTNSARPERTAKELDLESTDGGIEDERDLQKRQVFHGWQLTWLAYQATGVIYGDIGTSPLYVYSSTFTADPSYDDLLGALSLIIWTVTLMVSVKYMFIVLRADDEGEGGTFALYSLISRFANITDRDPREASRVKIERVLSNEMHASAKTARNFIEKSRVAKVCLKLLGVFGVALVMSDGVLTPAQSVLGAIQGLEVVKPDISNATIVGVSCAILIILFFIQPFGTTKLASSFAPIVIIWLLFNFVFGIYNLVVFDASVLKAFSPYFAGAYLVRNKTEGWKSLGGILLAFTGVEALFADVGAFSRRAVQISWLIFAFPCLLLAYIGQAAYISINRSAWTNPFYNTVPPGMFYPSLVIAILAAIVASQAMITAAFQLLTQIMKLSYFPQIKLVHTSKHFFGQVYIPFANWLLMIGTVVVTAAYNNTTKLGHAYGVCVVLVTFITTNMVALVALIVWRVPIYIVVPIYLVFGALDGVYLSSALTKVPDGAWFTLAVAIILSSIFILWRFGKEQQWEAETEDRFPPAYMIEVDTNTTESESQALRLTPAFGGYPINPIRGMGIFFDKAGQASTTPTVFVHFLQKFHASPEVVVFFHLRPVHMPTVPPEERYTVTRCFSGAGSRDHDEDKKQRVAMPNCFRLVIRHGYMDVVVTEDLGMLIYEQIRNYIIRGGFEEATSITAKTSTPSVDEKQTPTTTTDNNNNNNADSTTTPSTASQRRHSPVQQSLTTALSSLQSAYNSQTIYIVGKEQLRIATDTNMFRKTILWCFLWLRENSRTKIQTLDVAVQKLVEVGFVKEVR